VVAASAAAWSKVTNCRMSALPTPAGPPHMSFATRSTSAVAGCISDGGSSAARVQAAHERARTTTQKQQCTVIPPGEAQHSVVARARAARGGRHRWSDALNNEVLIASIAGQRF
jgi:hypothetical protein